MALTHSPLFHQVQITLSSKVPLVLPIGSHPDHQRSERDKRVRKSVSLVI